MVGAGASGPHRRGHRVVVQPAGQRRPVVVGAQTRQLGASAVPGSDRSRPVPGAAGARRRSAAASAVDGRSVHPERPRVAEVGSGHLDRRDGPGGPGRRRARVQVRPTRSSRSCADVPAGRAVHRGDGRSDPRSSRSAVACPPGDGLLAYVVTHHARRPAAARSAGSPRRNRPPSTAPSGAAEQVDEGRQVRGHHLCPRGQRLQHHDAEALPGHLRGDEHVRARQQVALGPFVDTTSTRQPARSAAFAGGVPWPATHTSTSPTRPGSRAARRAAPAAPCAARRAGRGT